MFTPKTLSFLRSLKRNNKREWFHSRRDQFNEHCRAPMIDKTPMKTNIAATFPHRALGRMNGASFYFEVGPDYVWIGGGVYRPDTSQLHLLREHIAVHYRRLDTIVKAPAFKKRPLLDAQTLATFKTLSPVVKFLNEPLIAAESPSRKAHFLLDE